MISRRIATTFTHTQDSLSDTWTVSHNLSDYPIVSVYVLYQGSYQMVVPSAVTYDDLNTCTISFSVPYSGFATVV